MIESKANPGEKVSAEACKLKGKLYEWIKKINSCFILPNICWISKLAQYLFLADCSCSDFVSSSGYGNCQKSYKHGPFCYVNQPSTCKDLVGSKDFRQKQYSWEACQNE